MAPIYGQPNYSFLQSSESSSSEESSEEYKDHDKDANLTEMAFWYMIVLVGMLLVWFLVFFCLRIVALRQKTRNPQQRRMYGASRGQPTLPQDEPTIYVSPTNLPPPPKYEALAPPSYEEVVGIHYPSYQTTSHHVQPITVPITAALAQGSARSNSTETTVVAVVPEVRRTSVNVSAS